MSSTSGSSGQVISLPKGGGALQGLGEKFSPDLHTGTGNFTVPIALPPGRNGFAPQLSLVYSTGNGNGPFGLGWSLSVPGVSRRTSKGVPRYHDAGDVFILSGAEDLVRVEPLSEKTRYAPRTEGLFARIFHYKSAQASDEYWEVRSKDGLVSRYGTEGQAGSDPAVLAHPAERSHVFAWKLTETRDPFGNRIAYEYLRDAGQERAHHWDQLYLQRIRYVDYEDTAGQEQFLISVAFDYGDPDSERPDPFSDYRAGFEIRTRKRCERIIVRTHAGQERLVRAYELVYLDERVAAGELPVAVLPPNGVSLLSRIKVVGYDDSGAVVEELLPLEFGYTRFEPEERTFFPASGRDLPARSLGSPDLELVDLFGNGLPDLLEMNGTVRYWRNLGGGTFDLPRPMRDAPPHGLADPGVQMIDADGDGRIDLLVTENGLSGYYPLRFDGLWDRRSFRRFRQAPSFSLEDPEVRLVDLDGDGVTDAIRSGSRLECFFNHSWNGGWGKTRFVERQSLEAFPNINFSDPRVKWADMTGDGLQDIVLVYDGNVEYWPNLGRGSWGRRVSMRNSPRFPYGYDPRRILVGDVDGDGAADLVYVDHGRVLLWMNRSGNGWSDPVEIDGTPPVSDMDAVRLVDLLSTGVAGVLWSADASAVSGRPRMFFLDFTGGTKPYLLSEMDNHMGAVTQVEYAPSTRFFLNDQKRPETRWKTPLPFPVQVVARVEVIDHLSRGKLTTEYAYHHGYWDGAEREFRGFGFVEQRDTEDFARYNGTGLHGADVGFEQVGARFAPPTLTKTWFHQGPIGEEFGEWEEGDYSDAYWQEDPQILTRPSGMTGFLKGLPRRAKRDALRALRGQILRTELYALDGSGREGRPYTVTESLPGVCEVVFTNGQHALTCDPPEPPAPPPGGEAPHRILFPHLLAQRTTQWERGDDPMTQFTFTDGYANDRPRDYDDYGQLLRQTQVACPRGWRTLEDAPAAGYLATRTVTDYAASTYPDTFMVDRVARTTTYELQGSAGEKLLDLRDRPDTDASLAIIGQTLNFYDGAAFQGLGFGALGKYGAPVRTESLVLTDAILQDAYGTDEPPYFKGAAWTPEYPAAFQAALPQRAGYLVPSGPDAARYAPGYFVATERQQYDFHAGPGRGLVLATRDPLGNEVSISYEMPYDFLPQEVTDPAGLKTTAEYDYRVLQPKKVIDPNGNEQRFGFTPTGLPAWAATIDKAGGGDTVGEPGTRFSYDFLAFENSPPSSRQPISVRTIRRVHHAGEPAVPAGEEDAMIETVEYSDGFGRLLQTRTQAEEVRFGDAEFGGGVLPAAQGDPDTNDDVVGQANTDPNDPNVVVSGWQVYDNKGRVVEKYEPFFSAGWDYRPPEKQELGQKAAMYYDPRGQIVRTENPDGSEQRVIYGVPGSIAAPDLTDPDTYEPTPWEAYTYDAGDNAGRTPSADPGADTYEHLWNTPASAVVDALGRTVETVDRNRESKQNPADPLPPIEIHRTRSTYDIRSNLLTVEDALGRVAFEHVYDLANRPLRIESIDAGIRLTVLDAAGSVVEGRDSKGALVLHAYDALNRPTRLWARDRSGENVTLRERLVYGDDSAGTGPSEPQAKAQNLLGKLYRHDDEAGRLTFASYDFKGNPLEKTRQVIDDSEILATFAGPPSDWKIEPFRVDWDNAPVLGHSYDTSLTYDGLNRVKTLRYPQDADGTRKELRTRYNRAGALERVELEGETYVAHIAYNAKGQRTLVAYGNGVMTRYAYDEATFRLARLRTERFEQPAPGTFRPKGSVLQDFAYTYDLAGNILKIFDRSPKSGIPNTVLGEDALYRRFTYDALYRLLSATGRETDVIAPPVPPPKPGPWDGPPRQTDVTKARAYTESYTYDKAGNLLQLQHTAGAPHDFTRNLTLQTSPGAAVPDNNRLATMSAGGTVYQYGYDANGNLIRENTERHFGWDHSDRMRTFRTQAGKAEPSTHAHYLYDAGGQRVMKFVRKQGGQYEVTVYVDGLFEHYRWDLTTLQPKENNRLHVMDDKSRIALVHVGDKHPDDAGPVVQYHLGDHLGSSNIVIGGATAADDAFINQEEFTPYGETSFGSFGKKRYRFTGKERDEESGLYYHGARYYTPWLARWVSCDPAGIVDGVNIYWAFRNNPQKFTDPTGLQADGGTDYPSGGTPPTVDERSEANDVVTVQDLHGYIDIMVPKYHDVDNCLIDSGIEFDPALLQERLVPMSPEETIEYWMGILYGTVQAAAPGGFIAPSPGPDSHEFELGRGHGMTATGGALVLAGGTGTVVGGGATATVVGAPVGAPVAAISAGIALEAGIDVVVGIEITGRAISIPPSRFERTESLATQKSNAERRFMPERYRIDMRGAPKGSPTTAEGWQRNARWFWKQLKEKHPQLFSKANKKLIDEGYAPIVDKTWLKHHRSHAAFEGDFLVHHHIERGAIAAGIPRRFHQIFHALLHYH